MPVCQYHDEGGHEVPLGGEGGLGWPPWGKQHCLVGNQKSELLQSLGPVGVAGAEGVEGLVGWVGGAELLLPCG